MNDEIREILDKLKDTADTSFFAVCGSQEELDKMPKSITKILSIPSKDAKILLDYITNLQKENDYYFKKNNELSTLNTSLRNARDDYKSRVEKTTEKLSFIDEALENDTLNVSLCIAKINSALNILQNGGENDD